MIAAILAVLSRIPAAVWLLALLVAAAGGWIWIERGRVADWRLKAEAAESRAATLRGQLDQVTELNTENVAELGRLRAGHARDLADLGAELERARKAGTRLTIVHQEIARDPDAAAPLADRCPALDRFLDRMLEPGAGTADRDADRAGGGAAPAGPAGVPAGAVAPANAADDRPGPRLDRGASGGGG